MKRSVMRLAAGSGPTFGVDDLACAAATHLGFWADENLEVTWTPVRGGVAAIQAVMDRAVDCSYGGLGPVLKYVSEGHPARVVVSMARALAQNLVVQAKISQPDDLRGVSWAIDGVGALSHHMARLVARSLKIPESEINWLVAGPPPERIAMLLAGTVDASLIRVEEAAALSLDPNNTLHTLLGFSELKQLVPIQPHGVLSVRNDYIEAHQEELSRLVAGMIKASRALNDDFSAFETTYKHYVKVTIPDDHIKMIWERERDANGFALNGELSAHHWQQQSDLFYELNPDLPKVGLDKVIEDRFVKAALQRLGER